MRNILNLLHHLFVPKEENNYRARALHIDFLSYYLIFALFLTFGFKKINLANILGYATDISIEKLYQLTNEKRQQFGLPTLSYSEKLSQAAAQKAQDMFAKNYWAHYAPDGTTPWDFILRTGYKYEFAGENLAKNFLFSQGVVDAWMNSSSHRSNILKFDYTEVGFAVVNGVLNGEETTLVVQMFAKPMTGVLTQINNQPPNTPQTVVQPTVAPQSLPSKEKILAKQAVSSPLSLQKFTFDLNLIFLIFLAVSLIMDLYFSAKLNIIRITGKNIAHLIFIGFIIFGLTLFSRGAIM